MSAARPGTARDEALEVLLRTRIVAVLRLARAEPLLRVARAIGEGGVKAIEVTLTTPGALEAIRALSGSKPEGTLVGAGTVLDEAAAVAAIAAGADFVVSPVFRPEVVRACRERSILVVPGAFTPGEILAAWEAGGDVVKVFPAGPLGPGYFKDVRGPLPQVRLMPTGGVTVANARDFLAAGACCVGIGSDLLPKGEVEGGNWGALTERARTLTASLG